MHPTKKLALVFTALLLAAGGAQQAFALNYGDTLTADTKLTANLAGSGTALVVGAHGITIDLNGYTVSGDGTGLGIDNTGGYDNVTIKNGTITGFQEGIRAVGANNLEIEDMTVSGAVGSGGTTGVIHVLDSSNLTVDGCTVSVSAAPFGPQCIRLDSVKNARILDCEIDGGWVGVSFFSIGGLGTPTTGTVEGCTVDACFIGVMLANTDHATVTDNVIKNGLDFPGVSGSQGIRMGFAQSVSNMIISDNEVFSCVRGILGNTVGTVSNAVIRENDVHDNYFGSIQLFNSTKCEIMKNDCYDNDLFGISLASGTTKCKVVQNTVSDNGARGIVLTDDAADNQITNNKVLSNGLDGIALLVANVGFDGCKGNHIINNTSLGNGSWDLFHDALSTPNTWRSNTYVTKSGADIK
jgi:parallel beta-helix repeat protein